MQKLGSDLGVDTFRILELDYAVDPTEPVPLAQMQAAIAAGGGGASGYSNQDYEKTSTYVYVGYKTAAGAWYIYRRTIATNLRQYASGGSSYAGNWTGRSGLTYA